MKRGKGRVDGSTETMSASSYVDADNDASQGDGHRDACHVNPSCVNASMGRTTQATSMPSHVDGGTSPLYCSYNVTKYNNVRQFFHPHAALLGPFPL